MERDEKIQLAQLIRGQRWAALATLHENAPFASMVAYAPEADFSGFLLHLSRLAPHTRNLLADPRASLVIGEPDTGGNDPQTLGRVSVQGTVIELTRGSTDYTDARERYLEHLPEAEQLFGFGDFMLFRLLPADARYTGGFARAYTLSRAQLEVAARAAFEEST